MAQYLEELVQEISTHCDTKGFEKLISAQKEAIKYNKILQDSFSGLASQERVNISQSKALTQAAFANIKVKEAQTKSNLRLLESQQKHLRKMKAINKEAKSSVFGNPFKLFAGFMGLQGIRSFIETAREIDLVQRSITGLTKSTQDWDYIQQQAFRTGARIKDVAKGYRNFYAAANMAGFDKSSIQGMYGDLLTSTRSIGASPQQTAGALLALEQMISKGRVSMEELRRQLGNALPGAFEIGAKAMKMTTAEFNDFVKNGKLASVEFVPKFIKALKDEYAGGFKEATKTMDYALNNLSSAWTIFQYEFSKGSFAKGFVDVTNQLSMLLMSPQLKIILQFVGNILAVIMKLVTQIVKFVSNHLPIIIGILGTHGLARVLAMNVGLFAKLFQFMKICFGGRMLLAIKNITKGLWAMSIPMIKFYAIALAVIAALAVVQDLYYALPHMKAQGYKSFLGESLEAPAQPGEYTKIPAYHNEFTKPKKGALPNIPLTNALNGAIPGEPRLGVNTALGNGNEFNTTVNIKGSTNMDKDQVKKAVEDGMVSAINRYKFGLGK